MSQDSEPLRLGKGILELINETPEAELTTKPLTYADLKKALDALGKMPPPMRTWYADTGTVKYLLEVGGLNAFRLYASDYDEVIIGKATFDLLKEHGYEADTKK